MVGIKLMARSSMLLLLLLALPTASACSWVTPPVGDVQPTEQGLVWKRGEDLVRGEPGNETLLAALGPFASFRAAPDGSEILYAQAVGGIGGDCRPMGGWSIHRWTPGGTTNLTSTLPALPLAVHWPTHRGVVANASGASVVDLATGAVLARLAPGHSESGVDYAGHSTSAIGAAWSPAGDMIALVTSDTAWIFAPDGSYLFPQYAGFPLGANGYGSAAFSADGRTLAVASMQGDRFTTLRTLDVSGPEARFAGTHLDVRGFRAIAWGPHGELAVAWQYPPLAGDGSRGNASVALYGPSLDARGERRWENATIRGVLAWEGERIVAVVDETIVRLDPPAGEQVVAQPAAKPVPAPAPVVLLALGAAIALSARRRRAARRR